MQTHVHTHTLIYWNDTRHRAPQTLMPMSTRLSSAKKKRNTSKNGWYAVCNTHQHTATRCTTLQHTATHCNTHCNTLQHTLQQTATYTATHCNIHCNTPKHTVTHRNTLQHNSTHCNTLQHTATHCNSLQHTAAHCIPSMQMYMHACKKKCLGMFIYLYKYIDMHMRMSMYTYIHTCIGVSAHVYFHVYAYMWLHTFIHTNHLRAWLRKKRIGFKSAAQQHLYKYCCMCNHLYIQQFRAHAFSSTFACSLS